MNRLTMGIGRYLTHSKAAIMSNASSQWGAYGPFRPLEEIYAMNSENADLRLKLNGLRVSILAEQCQSNIKSNTME